MILLDILEIIASLGAIALFGCLITMWIIFLIGAI